MASFATKRRRRPHKALHLTTYARLEDVSHLR